MARYWIIAGGLLLFVLGLEVCSAKNRGKGRPRNMTVEAHNSTSIIARWEAPRSLPWCPVSRYVIRLKSEGAERSLADRVEGNQTYMHIGGLKPDTKYYVRVVAVGCNGKSQPTKWGKAKTLPGPTAMADQQTDMRQEITIPGKPTQVRTRTLTDSIILTWEAPADNVLVRGYMVGYGEGVPDVNWQYVDAETREFTIKNLKPSTQYVISLRAFNNYGKGPVVYDLIYTREENSPTIGPLTAPIALKSKVLSPSTIWLQWTDPSLGRAQKITDNRYYVVTYMPQPQGKIKTITVKALNVVIYDLQPATTFEFRVKTKKGDNSTDFGISVYNTTYESKPDSVPRSFSVIPTNDTTSATLSWSPPKRPNGVITGYLIYYTTNAQLEDKDWIIEGVLGDILQVRIRGLLPGTTYYFKIHARNSKGYGPMSNIVMYTTPGDGQGITTISEEEWDDPTVVPEPERVPVPVVADSEEEEEQHPQVEAQPDISHHEEVEVPTEHPMEDEIDVYPKAQALAQVQPEDDEAEIEYRTGVYKQLPKLELFSHKVRNKKDSSNENIKFFTMIKHKLSVVITWSGEETDSLMSVQYRITYHKEGNRSTQKTRRNKMPLFVLEDLDPEAIYPYEVVKIDRETNTELWKRAGIVDTHYKTEK